MAESVGKAMSRIIDGSVFPNSRTEPTAPSDAIQIFGNNCSLSEFLAKSAVGIGAKRQSFRNTCPVNQDGGACRISHGSGNS